MISPLRASLFGPAVLLLALTAATAHGDSWNEEFFGDLSNTPESPTPLTILHPANYLTGSIGGGDFDLIALNVPAFHKLESIVLFSYSGASQSFAGLQAGDVWTAGTGFAVNPASLLGWTHFGPAAAGAGVNQNILDDISVPKNGSLGFTTPLLPGKYTLLLQDTGGVVNYTLQFNLSYNLKPVGDFNGDFLINRFDIAKWRTDAGPIAGSDADADGDSDGNDLLVWQRNLNRTNFGLTAAPEPTAVALAAWVLVALLAARPRTATTIA
jgi:hypothetical protein